MKKRFFILLMFIVILFSSCELFLTNGDQYFWALDDQYQEKNRDVEDEVAIEISYSSNQKFIMTHGEDEIEPFGFPTKQEAEAEEPNISFTLEGDNGIVFDNSSYAKTVENLSRNVEDWHITQIFDVNNIIIGETYYITGKTHISGSSLSSPVVVESTIKVIFR